MDILSIVFCIGLLGVSFAAVNGDADAELAQRMRAAFGFETDATAHVASGPIDSAQQMRQTNEIRHVLGASLARGQLVVSASEAATIVRVRPALVFAEDTATIRADFLPVLNSLGKFLADGDAAVRIRHTSPLDASTASGRQTAWSLTTARALAIVDALGRESGLSDDRFALEASRPIATKAPDATLDIVIAPAEHVAGQDSQRESPNGRSYASVPEFSPRGGNAT